MKKKFFGKKRFFFGENHPPMPYKVQKDILASFYKSIMTTRLLSTNLERFLRRIKSPLTR